MSLFIDFQNWRNQDPFSDFKANRNGAIFDNFSCLLFHLINKADHGNLWRLRRAFPQHVNLWEWWMQQLAEPTEEQIKEKANDIQKKIPADGDGIAPRG